MAMLGIDPVSIAASVLSHGHLDHYGGFPALAGALAAKGRVLPLFVGGEEAFCERVAMIGAPPPVMGTLDRGALAEAGYDVRLALRPQAIANQAFTTGVIPLETSERATIPTRMRPGIGCAREELRADKRALAEVTDDGEHELATCYAWKPPITMCTLVIPLIACARRTEFSTPRWLHDAITTSPSPLNRNGPLGGGWPYAE